MCIARSPQRLVILLTTLSLTLSLPAALAEHYLAIELGTLGGAQTEAYAINDYGQVVGRSLETGGLTHAFHWENGQLSDLNAEMPWGRRLMQLDYAVAFGISNTGHIAGATQCTPVQRPDEVGSDVPGGKYLHACVFRPAVSSDLTSPYPGDALTYLGTLANQAYMRSSAAGVSPNGLYIAGWSDVHANGQIHGFVVTPINGRWADTDVLCDAPYNPSLLDLGTLSARDSISSATAVNDAGQVVGWSDGPDNGYIAFVVTPADVDADGSPEWFVDANSDGANDRMVSLGTLGGTNSWARAINADGLIVGEADTADGTTQAFIWRPSTGTMESLGTLGGADSSAAAINNHGQVVGWSLDAQGNMRAFVWQDGVMSDLNELLPSGFKVWLAEARGINGAGQIVGWGTVGTADAQIRMAVLLEPGAAPEDPDQTSDTPGTINGTHRDASLDPIAAAPIENSTPTGSSSNSTTGQQQNSTPPVDLAHFLCGTGVAGMLPLMLAGLTCMKLAWRRRR